MTSATTAPGDGDRSQALYEELRGQAIAGSAAGGRLGLVVLLREGVAAWLARRSSCSDWVETAAPADRRAGAALVSDQVQAGMIRVLASMVLGDRHTGAKEMNA